jgi:hypothetical protein
MSDPFVRLEYYVPISNTIFVQSNVSCLLSQAGPITGSFNLGISTDPNDTRISVKVEMSYSGADIRERTSVCLMNLAGSDGVYIYVCHYECASSCQYLTFDCFRCLRI